MRLAPAFSILARCSAQLTGVRSAVSTGVRLQQVAAVPGGSGAHLWQRCRVKVRQVVLSACGGSQSSRLARFRYPPRSGRGATERRAAACGLSAARARRTRAGAAASCVPVTGCRVKSHQRERLMTGCGVGDMVNGRENACRESWVNVLLLL
ncbi:hypothetical protein LU604_04040 [Erwinia tracheiphila]|uniref:hypothetical protein n=1 Tax=Erwinia tracheiphila TaxID=65700 RepID=UPI001F18BF8A|nr:hypothetical protein [Erwinia tracheiphila]UIA84244.1 hypothetical protein LU604_04040 [Erwinia tracheiphila]UIA92824.1 hypothetical protein LU632_03990 [Erwinia tracheiphila]